MSTSRLEYVVTGLELAFKIPRALIEEYLLKDPTRGILVDFFSPDGPVSLLFYVPSRKKHSKKVATDVDVLDLEGKDDLLFDDIDGFNPLAVLVPEKDSDFSAISGKVYYILRVSNKEVSQTKPHLDMACGEVVGHMLDTFIQLLKTVYTDLFRSSTDWGVILPTVRNQFLDGTVRLQTLLQDARDNLQESVELFLPKKDDQLVSAADATGRTVDELWLEQCVETVESWISRVERMLAETKLAKDSEGGPHTELDFWRSRMAKCNSVMEQLRHGGRKSVINTLTFGRAPILKRWHTVESALLDALNEAKDNVKYLIALEKYYEPLYKGDIEGMIECLPTLMNNVKLMHTLAKYYTNEKRMPNLLRKLSYQMIERCKVFISGNGTGTEGQAGRVNASSPYDKNPEDVIAVMQKVIQLNAAFQAQYRITKEKLAENTRGNQFDFNEQFIFGRFNLFEQRLVKLIELFSTIHQFNRLQKFKIDGFESQVREFFRLLESFRRSSIDPLQYTRNDFDKQYMEFNIRLQDIETTMQEFVNRCFENISNTESALKLLKKFRSVLDRDSLKNDLDSKYMVIFQKYHVDLETVQRLYEKDKFKPPLVRNAPPVSGALLWVRQLYRRISDPMAVFAKNREVMSTKESKRVVRKFNRVASALVEYETLYLHQWWKQVELCKSGLSATLVIRHPEDDRLYVNFDRDILQLIRETRYLLRLGVDVPESAEMVLLQEEKFKSHYEKLSYLLREHDRVISRLRHVVKPLLGPLLQQLDSKLKPGMTTLTWLSMNIDMYLQTIHNALSTLDEILDKVNDVLENRIDKNLKYITKTRLVILPSDRQFSLHDFVHTQDACVKEQTSIIDLKNREIEAAVDDLVRYVFSAGSWTKAEEKTLLYEAGRLKDYYMRMLYTALLNAVKESFFQLKQRVGSAFSTGFFFVQQPLFDVDVELAIPDVVMNPSLENVQQAINRVAKNVLTSFLKLYRWGVDRESASDSDTFFYYIAQDKEIIKVLILLTGSIHQTKQQVLMYLKTFRRYDYLWKKDRKASFQQFMKTNPSLDDFNSELARYVRIENEIQAIPSVHNIGVLSLGTKLLKYALKAEAVAWKQQYAENLYWQAMEELRIHQSYIETTMKKLSVTIEDLEDVRTVMSILQAIREKEATFDFELAPCEDKFALLTKHHVQVPRTSGDEYDTLTELHKSWAQLRNVASQVNSRLAELQTGFKKDLVVSIGTFVTDVSKFRTDFELNGPMVQGLSPQEAIERLRRFKREFEYRNRHWQTYAAGEELFGLPKTAYPELVRTEKELKLLDRLYSLHTEVTTTIRGFEDILWVDVANNIDKMSEQVQSYQLQCKRLPKSLRGWEAYNELRVMMDSFQDALPLLRALSHPAVRPRHWKRVMQVTGSEFRLDPESFKLKTVLDAGLLQVFADIEDICGSALQEEKIEMKMGSLMREWEDCVFVFQPYKNRGSVLLKGVAEVIEKVEETHMTLGSMMASRYVEPFRTEVSEWMSKMSVVSEVIEQWIVVQNMWTYMEAVFSSGDIKRQLPLESKKFERVDKKYMQIMSKALDAQNIIKCCYGNDLLRNLLPHLNEQLEQIQKSLTGYLETKRSAFPRFYFVSDPVLLEMLSHGSDAQAIQSHFISVFDSIFLVGFDRVERQKAISISSPEGETVALVDPFIVSGSIEEWLTQLETAMKVSMDEIIQSAAQEYREMGLKEFINKFPAQVVLLGVQLMWTEDCELAITEQRSNRQSYHAMEKRITGLLRELVDLTTSDLTKLQRTKVETLVTVQVHQRDVFDMLKRSRIKEVTDFEWMRQCRFYYRPELDGDSAIVISICDADFEYCNEYLGCKERLVITPLTDRCYLTIAQALGMFLGGAPTGPAGTGKTETTKDLGRSLGKWVVVFNCSDQMDYRAMAKIYKGLCQSGAWGCFDEFNRIDLEVLSVAAQQVLCILTAMRERQKTFLFTDGKKCHLDPKTGFFITMNPGYAGRQELPENLKTLFRGIAMMVPDTRIIMRVKLAACGFQNNEVLSKKFDVLYRLCRQQLSNQRHYDFGLRNILSVLRTAGTTKRTSVETPEDLLLMRTLRDMNLSKFVAEDVPLFLSLIQDLFPKVVAEKARYYDVEAAVARQVKEMNLQHHEPWVEKVIQVYETSLVRHGLMVVGPASSGKSKIYTTLLRALSDCGVSHKEFRMNPKAITASQMFGTLGSSTTDWTDGIFSALWRKASKVRNSKVWMILDGPVDSLWIENLNTVLDDNKLLTLANGDRIPMTSNMKACFEPEHLANASPATVSRAGIIYVSESVLDWRPLVASWLPTRENEAEAAIYDGLFKKFGDATFDFVRKETQELVEVPRVCRVQTALDLLSCFTNDSSSTAPEPAYLERLFLFAWSWAIGGLMSHTDRTKFSQFVCGKSSVALKTMTSGDSTIFDYFVRLGRKGEWAPWAGEVPSFAFDPQRPYSQVVVPTIDTVRYQYLLSIAHESERNVLFIGDVGTAKTTIMQTYLQQSQSEDLLVKQCNFSSYTTTEIFQRSMESFVEKRQGKSFGPPGGKKMILFIDDLGMPEINEWGDQVTNELVRQLLGEKGFYSLEKPGEFKTILGTQYFAAMATPGNGKNDIPNRLKGRFAAYYVTMPSRQLIEYVFGSIIQGHFDRERFPEAVCNLAGSLTQATVSLWERVRRNLLPSPSKVHYCFNLRELSRICEGLLMGVPDVMTSARALTLLWLHECRRVLSDRLISEDDQHYFEDAVRLVLKEHVPSELVALDVVEETLFVDFLRQPETNEEGEIVSVAKKVYEPSPSLEEMRTAVEGIMQRYNDEHPRNKLDLVLFDDALRQIGRITRVLRQPRGSMMLVGVGGSGKQSLTRLATYICGYKFFQITTTKAYNHANFLDDIRELYKRTGVLGEHVTFVFTDNEVKQELFLERISSFMSTGEIQGLFVRDELDVLLGDLRQVAKKELGLTKELDAYEVIHDYFIQRVRDRLHVVLCFSPVGQRFRTRSRKFPALLTSCTIDWVFPWPAGALRAVAAKFLGGFAMDVRDEGTRAAMVEHMAFAHEHVTRMAGEYLEQYRRYVYVTPKSYLSFLNFYKSFYTSKHASLQTLRQSLQSGLSNLLNAADGVAEMKQELKIKEKNLEVAQIRSNKLLQEITSSRTQAEKERNKVEGVKNSCQDETLKISQYRDECERDLLEAKPALEEAAAALDAITAKDVSTLKQLRNPPEVIKRIMDTVSIFLHEPMVKVQRVEIKGRWLFQDSYKIALTGMMSRSDFLESLRRYPKDNITDETCELLQPYLDMDDFTTEKARSASGNVAGLCSWVRGMYTYHFIAKEVQPKIEALKKAEVRLEQARHDLSTAEKQLSSVLENLTRMQIDFDAAVSEKQQIQNDADLTKRRMESANELITGLGGERVRWAEQLEEINEEIARLVGDCAAASAFVSYAGPFNQIFRDRLVERGLQADCHKRGIPMTPQLDLVKFVADETEMGEWAMQGLPTDVTSVQNGILVTRSSRYPLLVDPQKQGLAWLKKREEDRRLVITTLANRRLRDVLEDCMGNGRALVIENVEEELDPMLDPLLEKQTFVSGKTTKIIIADVECDIVPEFRFCLMTKLPNPHFSPEICAKVTIIDFTVTMQGLEDQLLGRVISREKPELEEQQQVLRDEVTGYKKKLKDLGDDLLNRLATSKTHLLDDHELINVLAVTKSISVEVSEKLKDAAAMQVNILESREEYRPVAIRGSVLYFLVSEMAGVNPMYQTSLQQVLDVFDLSMDKAEAAPLASRRIENIIQYLTFALHRYVSVGFFEKDKTLWTLLMALKIKLRNGDMSFAAFQGFVRGGSTISLKETRKRVAEWIPDTAWLHLVECSRHLPVIRTILDEVTKNSAAWKEWYGSETPETTPFPGIAELPPLDRLFVVRCFREDRTLLAATRFIHEDLGRRYVEAVPVDLDSHVATMGPRTPFVFSLSQGSDPTSMIESLAKKSKRDLQVVAMGQGQEVVARQMLRNAMTHGSWVLIQNGHLGLRFLPEVEDIIMGQEEMEYGFRLFVTSEPTKRFPIGLLQMSFKLTNQPPSGMRAGLQRSYNWVTQDMLDTITRKDWRCNLYATCFIHSLVQERRKFGPLGWNVPYEFNHSDLTASVQFLQNLFLAMEMMQGSSLSWSTIRYMIGEVMYGGRITDDFDRRLMKTYCDHYFTPKLFSDSYKIYTTADMYVYRVPEFTDISKIRNEIERMPLVDSPELFGLHVNADLAFRTQQTRALMDSILETQPKSSTADMGLSREAQASNIAVDLLSRLPAAFKKDYIREFVKNIGGPVPLNVFLVQETTRMGLLLNAVQSSLLELKHAIAGTAVLSNEVQKTLDALFEGRVPPSWVPLSWEDPTLGVWFETLLQRYDQLKDWVSRGRPNSFWLPGWFNPQGFLTAAQQEIVRQKGGLSLDVVVIRTEVTKHAWEGIPKPPDDGFFLHGLYLDGAAWEKRRGQLVDQLPKILNCPLPVVFLTVVHKSESYQDGTMYECPVYTVAQRGVNNYVFSMKLRSTEAAEKWIMRGVALLCTKPVH